MEGLIPLVYRTIVQYKRGGQLTPLGAPWFEDSPSASYMRLPGDSGRYRASEMQSFSSSSAPTVSTASGATQSPRRAAVYLIRVELPKDHEGTDLEVHAPGRF